MEVRGSASGVKVQAALKIAPKSLSRLALWRTYHPGHCRLAGNRRGCDPKPGCTGLPAASKSPTLANAAPRASPARLLNRMGLAARAARKMRDGLAGAAQVVQQRAQIELGLEQIGIKASPPVREGQSQIRACVAGDKPQPGSPWPIGLSGIFVEHIAPEVNVF